jgi:pSer/pThr/pTyr-binding forkhead associated (FHA) protein
MAAFGQAAAILTVRRGPGLGRSFRIDAPAITIGRQEQCDFQVNDRWVSRQHARITWGGAGYLIEDLGTVNGTYVNGERISRPRALKSGDLLQLGSEVELGFQVSAPAPPVQMPAAPEVALAPESKPEPHRAEAPVDTEWQEAQKAASSALTSAIVGLLICGLILEPSAIAQARKARKVLGPGDRGYGKAVAAEVIGWIGLVLWVVAIIYQFSNM